MIDERDDAADELKTLKQTTARLVDIEYGRDERKTHLREKSGGGPTPRTGDDIDVAPQEIAEFDPTFLSLEV